MLVGDHAAAVGVGEHEAVELGQEAHRRRRVGGRTRRVRQVEELAAALVARSATSSPRSASNVAPRPRDARPLLGVGDGRRTERGQVAAHERLAPSLAVARLGEPQARDRAETPSGPRSAPSTSGSVMRATYAERALVLVGERVAEERSAAPPAVRGAPFEQLARDGARPRRGRRRRRARASTRARALSAGCAAPRKRDQSAALTRCSVAAQQRSANHGARAQRLRSSAGSKSASRDHRPMNGGRGSCACIPASRSIAATDADRRALEQQLARERRPAELARG